MHIVGPRRAVIGASDADAVTEANLEMLDPPSIAPDDRRPLSLAGHLLDVQYCLFAMRLPLDVLMDALGFNFGLPEKKLT